MAAILASRELWPSAADLAICKCSLFVGLNVFSRRREFEGAGSWADICEHTTANASQNANLEKPIP